MNRRSFLAAVAGIPLAAAAAGMQQAIGQDESRKNMVWITDHPNCRIYVDGIRVPNIAELPCGRTHNVVIHFG